MVTDTLSETSFISKLEQSYKNEENVRDDPEPKLARMSDTAVMDMKGIHENINRKPLYELKDTQVLTFDPSTNLHRKKPSLFLDLSSVTNVNNANDKTANIAPKTAVANGYGGGRGPAPKDNKIKLKNFTRQELPKKQVREEAKSP